MTQPIDWFDRGETLLFGEVVVAVLLGVVLANAGIAFEWILAPLFLFNFVVAWHFFHAAKALGKHAAWWGFVASLGPPGALSAWSQLRWARLYGDR